MNCSMYLSCFVVKVYTPPGRKNEEFPFAGSVQAEAGSITGGTLELGNQDVWPNFIQKTRDAYLRMAALGW